MIKHKIVITGGGGFIGTQVAWELSDAGHDITIVDRNAPVHYFPGTYRVSDYLDFFNNTDLKFDTVVHLAAEHLVEQSVTEPEKYYTNNVVKMKAMLDVMVARKIKNIIFSSSGNVYGRQGMAGPLKEAGSYYDPENPYASTKVAGELLIKDYAKAYGIKFVTFRYFNAAAADPQCRFGYVQRPATHVIPILCNKILNGEPFEIYGTDYNTKDGSCVRDYVHVADLARAHTLAFGLFDQHDSNRTFNIGCGSGGVSVRELIKHAGEIVGKEPVVVTKPRRAGDPAILTADITKAEELLNWTPKYNIRDTILHAWEWEKKFETSK
jgi:UDP-glucose 4-epimerase